MELRNDHFETDQASKEEMKKTEMKNMGKRCCDAGAGGGGEGEARWRTGPCGCAALYMEDDIYQNVTSLFLLVFSHFTL